MARIRNFPKSYKTLARQTSGLVGGRVSAPVPVVSPAPPNRALALAKAKAKALALAIVIARERKEAAITYSEPITNIQTILPAPVVPDYDLRREPGDPWQIPEVWATRLPANHYDFLRLITAYQRPDGQPKKRGYGPMQMGESCGIREMRLVRELTELSSVHLARTTLLPLRRTPGADFGPFLERLESLYRQQFSLADLKTSTTLLNQQYSTPSPLSGILGEWVARRHPDLLGVAYEGAMQAPRLPLVLEPTAGNGLLTVRFDPAIVAVNELEELRYRHLEMQGFAACTGSDAAATSASTGHSVLDYTSGLAHLYHGIITNPPFGSTNKRGVRHRYGTQAYELVGWEHVIAAYAVNKMADNGRAAIIIGGHHQFNANGKLVGRDWIFFNYLYHHFHVAHVLQLDSHKLYARQGATWPIRVILLDGVKREPAGHAPLGKAGAPLPILTTFAQVAQTIGLIS